MRSEVTEERLSKLGRSVTDRVAVQIHPGGYLLAKLQ